MKRSPPVEASRHEQAEKRREHRYRAEGNLYFFFDDPVRREISGRLVDYSQGGFRVIHDHPTLVSGQVVSFRHLLSAGQARVMWNRIVEGMIETGFVTLALHSTAAEGR